MEAPQRRLAIFYPYDLDLVNKMLQRAKDLPNAVIILSGDDGGVVLLVAQARLVQCSAETLARLVVDLQSLIRPEEAVDQTSMHLDAIPIGGHVPGGMGGAPVTEEVWLNRLFDELGVVEEIVEVVKGNRSQLDAVFEDIYIVFRTDSVIVREPRVRFSDKIRVVRAFRSLQVVKYEVARLNRDRGGSISYFLKVGTMRVDLGT